MLLGICTPNTLWFFPQPRPVMTLSGSQHTTEAQEFSETVTPRLKSLLLKSFKCFHIRFFFLKLNIQQNCYNVAIKTPLIRHSSTKNFILNSFFYYI